MESWIFLEYQFELHIYFISAKFHFAPRQFPRKVSQSLVFNFMANAGAEKTLLKLMLETGSQADVSRQSTTNSNHATMIQMRRVLELRGQTTSTESSSQVQSINNWYKLRKKPGFFYWIAIVCWTNLIRKSGGLRLDTSFVIPPLWRGV